MDMYRFAYFPKAGIDTKTIHTIRTNKNGVHSPWIFSLVCKKLVVFCERNIGDGKIHGFYMIIGSYFMGDYF